MSQSALESNRFSRSVSRVAMMLLDRRSLTIAGCLLVAVAYVLTATFLRGHCEVCGKTASVHITHVDFNSTSVSHHYCEEHGQEPLARTRADDRRR